MSNHYQMYQEGVEEEDSESGEQQSWIEWYCSLKGNEFFVRVDHSFIQDSFNLTGLDSQLRLYYWALDMILDNSPRSEIPQEQLEHVEEQAEQLYGLIHSRYIITQRGLEQMCQKFKHGLLGRCPRVLCNGQPTLPVGLTPLLNLESVRLFCPRCDEIYASKSTRHTHIDGAFFGPTFPHLFLLAYPELKPAPINVRYVPRVFGFRLHSSAYEQSIKYKKLQDDIDSRTQLLQTQAKQLSTATPQHAQQLILSHTQQYSSMAQKYMNIHTELYQQIDQQLPPATLAPSQTMTSSTPTSMLQNQGNVSDE